MKNSALLLIDLQNDYFPGGKHPLHEPEPAVEQSARILSAFREKGLPVIHIRHESVGDNAQFFLANTEGANIHLSVTPLAEETVIVKHQVNSFLNTGLKQHLDEKQIEQLVIVGAMSHMCIDAATRAASDLGYSCRLVHDACATLGLEFNGVSVPASQVHASIMAALQAYARVMGTDELLESL
ncbi:MAG: cysteine hydrolase [Gammaproteobacteria bacterium]|nr:cysteine hydrolase [Gammaproteobacteria bacterium]